MIDWRSLLTDLRIPWRDRGRNTSRGNLNVCCPFCLNDDGFHLSIAEETIAFYCYRNPNKHSGTSLRRLLVGLGVAYDEIPRITGVYATGKRQSVVPRSTAIIVSSLASHWASFPHAYEQPRIADYLRQRGFADPKRISLRYDLRCKADGAWACRVLLPIKQHGVTLTWTGRSVLSHIEPKYQVEAKADQNIPIVYVPDEDATLRARRIVIVEGPLDALKIASGADDLDVAAVALAGKNMSPERMLRIRELCRQAERIEVALDNDAGMMEATAMLGAFRALMLPGELRRLRVPAQFKDAGDMPEPAIADWIRETM